MFRKIRSIVHWEINILEEIKEYLIKQDEVNEEFRQELRKQKENSEDIRLRLIHIEDRLKIVDEDKIEELENGLWEKTLDYHSKVGYIKYFLSS